MDFGIGLRLTHGCRMPRMGERGFETGYAPRRRLPAPLFFVLTAGKQDD